MAKEQQQMEAASLLEEKTTETTPKAAVETERRYRVRINSGESKASKRPVTLTVNGKTCLVQRDQEVLLKPEFLEALQHAKELDYEVTDENGETQLIKGASRFSYSMLGAEDVAIGSLDTTPEKNVHAAA